MMVFGIGSNAFGATTQPLTASFNETVPAAPYRSDGHSNVPNPCDPDAFYCGTGSVSGFGAATDNIFFLDYVPTSRSCGDAIMDRVIALESGSLTLHESWVICSPGNSPNVPGTFKSWGNPFSYTGTFEISDSSGIFEGATGSGTSSGSSAGAQAHSQVSGQITL